MHRVHNGDHVSFSRPARHLGGNGNLAGSAKAAASHTQAEIAVAVGAPQQTVAALVKTFIENGKLAESDKAAASHATDSDLKIVVERRKRLAKKLESIEASQRATAKVLGVSHQTVGRDLDDGPHGPPMDPKANDRTTDDTDDGPHGPPNSFVQASGREVAEEARHVIPEPCNLAIARRGPL